MRPASWTSDDSDVKDTAVQLRELAAWASMLVEDCSVHAGGGSMSAKSSDSRDQPAVTNHGQRHRRCVMQRGSSAASGGPYESVCEDWAGRSGTTGLVGGDGSAHRLAGSAPIAATALELIASAGWSAYG